MVRITESLVRRIVALRNDGWTYRDVDGEMGWSGGTCYRLMRTRLAKFYAALIAA